MFGETIPESVAWHCDDGTKKVAEILSIPLTPLDDDETD